MASQPYATRMPSSPVYVGTFKRTAPLIHLRPWRNTEAPCMTARLCKVSNTPMQCQQHALKASQSFISSLGHTLRVSTCPSAALTVVEGLCLFSLLTQLLLLKLRDCLLDLLFLLDSISARSASYCWSHCLSWLSGVRLLPLGSTIRRGPGCSAA